MLITFDLLYVKRRDVSRPALRDRRAGLIHAARWLASHGLKAWATHIGSRSARAALKFSG